MSHYQVLLLILDFSLARVATLHYGPDSNVFKSLVNMLTKPSVFYYFATSILLSCFNKNDYNNNNYSYYLRLSIFKY